jgi:hypothetical protein
MKQLHWSLIIAHYSLNITGGTQIHGTIIRSPFCRTVNVPGNTPAHSPSTCNPMRAAPTSVTDFVRMI